MVLHIGSTERVLAGADKNKEKSAFSANSGLWQFKVLPFGFCNALAAFERLMERVPKGLRRKTCLVYLDDIIVMDRAFDELLKNLGEVLLRIAMAGLKVTVKKCSLFQNQVKYLCHIVATDRIFTNEDKIRAETDWPRLQNLHELLQQTLCAWAHQEIKSVPMT